MDVDVDVDALARHACVCTSAIVPVLQRYHGISNVEDCPSWTPLQLALTNGHDGVAILLLRAGARWTGRLEFYDDDDDDDGRVMVADDQGISALHVMAACGRVKVLEWIAKRSGHGFGPGYGSGSNRTDTATALHDQRILVASIFDGLGYGPLLYAREGNSDEGRKRSRVMTALRALGCEAYEIEDDGDYPGFV